MTDSSVRTTVTLPAELLRAVDRAVMAGRARSRNELLARALLHELAAEQRAAIDAAFAGMADDVEGQQESSAIAEEFAIADWEALRLGEEQR